MARRLDNVHLQYYLYIMNYLLLLDIIFQSGEFYDQGNGWWSELFNTIIGATIGSGATLWALYETFKRDKKNEDETRFRFQIEKIRYLKSLVEEIIRSVGKQNEFYLEFAEKVEGDTVYLPLLGQVPLNELEQVVTKLNQEDYYHSYLKIFGDTEAKVKEFRTIISLMNFLYRITNDSQITLMKSFEHDHERKIDLKKAIENSEEYAIGLIANKQMRETYPKVVALLDKSFQAYHEDRTDPSDLQYVFDKFINPAMNDLIDFGAGIPEVHNLLLKFKYAITSFNSIKIHNLELAAQYKEQHLKVSEAYAKLVQATQPLVAYKTS